VHANVHNHLTSNAISSIAKPTKNAAPQHWLSGGWSWDNALASKTDLDHVETRSRYTDSTLVSIFFKYVFASDAYYADISDDEFIYMSFDKRRELRIDLRRSIYRISPVIYWREDLYYNAFGLSAAQIVERLSGKVEFVEEALHGVFIILTPEVLPTAEMDALCWKAKNYL